ncbi:hypothetical protein DL89DRAFT_69774 [Linderina pennispora]|uniref:Secreted protein n=1 Tax=Linderina pennispora TaxID=61395 RepID=A0A1Y1VYK4_9FUNG|nr:uncharacterized protein DL89DRAFT_69774 [Linderina pennispora]ORX66333.1 hypothetical protein DL89DRAFT_69774 [Linderina pennispora]
MGHIRKLFAQFLVCLSNLVNIRSQLPHLRWLSVGPIYSAEDGLVNTETPQLEWCTCTTCFVLGHCPCPDDSFS